MFCTLWTNSFSMFSHCYNYTPLQQKVYRRKVSAPAERLLFFLRCRHQKRRKTGKTEIKRNCPLIKCFLHLQCQWAADGVPNVFTCCFLLKNYKRKKNKIIKQCVISAVLCGLPPLYLLHHCWHNIIIWSVWWIISCSSEETADLTFTYFFYRIQNRHNPQKPAAEQTQTETSHLFTNDILWIFMPHFLIPIVISTNNNN